MAFESALRAATGNRFLASLTHSIAAALQRSGRRVQLNAAQPLTLGEGQFVYLPERGLVSLLSNGRDGRIAEAAVIDRSGAVGLVEALALMPVGFTARALTAGAGLLVPAGALRTVVGDHQHAAQAAWRCAGWALREARHGAACRALHTVNARLADALLDFAERLGDYEVPVTQEVLSWSMGVCRTTVTPALGRLAADGLLRTGRSRILILDPVGLDAQACGCRKAAPKGGLAIRRAPHLPRVEARRSLSGSADAAGAT